MIRWAWRHSWGMVETTDGRARRLWFRIFDALDWWVTR